MIWEDSISMKYFKHVTYDFCFNGRGGLSAIKIFENLNARHFETSSKYRKNNKNLDFPQNHKSHFELTFFYLLRKTEHIYNFEVSPFCKSWRYWKSDKNKSFIVCNEDSKTLRIVFLRPSLKKIENFQNFWLSPFWKGMRYVKSNDNKSFTVFHAGSKTLLSTVNSRKIKNAKFWTIAIFKRF